MANSTDAQFCRSSLTWISRPIKRYTRECMLDKENDRSSIVEKALSFHDQGQPLSYTQILEDGQRRNGVRGRNDAPKRSAMSTGKPINQCTRYRVTRAASSTPALASDNRGTELRSRSRTSSFTLPSKTSAGRNNIKITSGVSQSGR